MMLRQTLRDISGYQEDAEMHWRCFELIGARLAQGVFFLKMMNVMMFIVIYF